MTDICEWKIGCGNVVHPKVMQILCNFKKAKFPANASVHGLAFATQQAELISLKAHTSGASLRLKNNNMFKTSAVTSDLHHFQPQKMYALNTCSFFLHKPFSVFYQGNRVQNLKKLHRFEKIYTNMFCRFAR
jgi:GDP-D-mannose dehydratase